MALKKDTKKPEKITSLLKGQAGGNLSGRLEKISEQTGLSSLDLIQKWILQEETLIGLTQRSKEPITKQAKTRPGVTPKKSSAIQKKRVKAIPSESGNTNYRNTLIKRVTELKKSGMSLVKIAKTFN